MVSSQTTRGEFSRCAMRCSWATHEETLAVIVADPSQGLSCTASVGLSILARDDRGVFAWPPMACRCVVTVEL